MDLFKKCYDFTMADDVKKLGIYPYFHSLESKQDTIVYMEGKRKIMIGSNNYLGLTSHPRVIAAGIAAITKFGSGVSGSRFLNGTTMPHIQLEKELATFLKKDGVVTFSTGFQSNLGIISALAGMGDIIFSDRENHASIYDGCKLSYATMIRYDHSNMAHLEQLLSEANPNKGMLIVTDGVFSMSGDIANLPEIVRLAKKYGARVMVDDAHGFGVLGPRGRGTAEFYGLEKEVDIIMGTFSKSLASLGGFMAADAKVVDFVKHKSRPFIFSAAITPASVASALEALHVLMEEPQRSAALIDIAAYARKKYIEKGLKLVSTSVAPIISILTYGETRTLLACKLLFNRGLYVNSVLPPAAPEGQCLIRTSYMATHTKAQIDEAATLLTEVLSTLPTEHEKIQALLATIHV